MKPGKPMTFATCNFHNKKKFIVCLPGNPVSAVVTAYLFLQPIINRLNGNNSKPIIISSKVIKQLSAIFFITSIECF